ncbi:MAG: lactoylglutathione lyase [Acidobacteria bacterium]|nr:lactoylglutathione lyase [Acidobacteriota bacterium]
MPNVEIILFVSDQNRSRDFYAALLLAEPLLDVPGMTEFELGTGVKLGLMPETGITKILSGRLPHPNSANGIPRCELYLETGDIEAASLRATAAGATEISPILDRDWGDKVSYFADPDGHIVAFACKSEAFDRPASER